MKAYFILLVSVCSGICALAQGTETIRAGEDLADHFTYLFPSFSDASVLLKKGTVLTAKMNFNTFLCKMMFIDSTGDTLMLSKLEQIDSIKLNNHTFFYNNGYYEIIRDFDSVRLVVFRKINVNLVAVGALGITSSTARISSFDNYLTSRSPGKLEAKDDLTVKRETSYFLIGRDGDMVNASRSNFVKTFSANKKTVEDFIRSNKINFNKQADLEKLFLFCAHSKT